MTAAKSASVYKHQGANHTQATLLSLPSDPAAVLRCEIRWPDPGRLRAREIISRARAIPTGKTPSLKLRRWVHWESKAERDGIRLVDISPAVTSFCEQPCTVEFQLSDGLHRTIPDLYIEGRFPTPWLIEFKENDDPELEFARARVALLAPHLARLGYRYALVLGSTIRRHGYLHNARWLARFGRRKISLVTVEKTRKLFERCSELTLRQLATFFGCPREAHLVAARLVLEGHAALDMSCAVTSDTPFVWLESQSSGEHDKWLLPAFNVISEQPS